jgi:hypothetical protein
MTDPTTIYKAGEVPRRVWAVDLGGWIASGWSLEPVTESSNSVTDPSNSVVENSNLGELSVDTVDASVLTESTLPSVSAPKVRTSKKTESPTL